MCQQRLYDVAQESDVELRARMLALTHFQSQQRVERIAGVAGAHLEELAEPLDVEAILLVAGVERDGEGEVDLECGGRLAVGIRVCALLEQEGEHPGLQQRPEPLAGNPGRPVQVQARCRAVENQKG